MTLTCIQSTPLWVGVKPVNMMQLFPWFSKNERSQVGPIELYESFKKSFLWLVAEKKVRIQSMRKMWWALPGLRMVGNSGKACGQPRWQPVRDKDLSPTAARNRCLPIKKKLVRGLQLYLDDSGLWGRKERTQLSHLGLLTYGNCDKKAVLFYLLNW